MPFDMPSTLDTRLMAPGSLPDTWDVVGCALLHHPKQRQDGGQGKPPTCPIPPSLSATCLSSPTTLLCERVVRQNLEVRQGMAVNTLIPPIYSTYSNKSSQHQLRTQGSHSLSLSLRH